uniref:Uncharacterized protein n=1 Tax=viral metagenome TaxID=1070528 RepID=A0A6H2A348_9ZZZZ
MKIIGEIEANNIPKVGQMAREMKLTHMGSEIAVIVIPLKEMEWMKQEFYRIVKQKQLMWDNQAALEKSELFHMIGIALRNSKKSDCTWFREAAMKIDQDAGEFDQHSIKTLMFTKKDVYIILAYNGKHVGGLGSDTPSNVMKG